MKMRVPTRCAGILVAFAAGAALAAEAGAQDYSVLVFSRTEGFRHASIETGVQVLQELGAESGFRVVATEDAAHFAYDSLRAYAAVVFLNTSGDVLSRQQERAFERYIGEGGGFVGIHGAAATEYDWPWYNELVGAFFDNHPEVQPAQVLVTDRRHPATAPLPLRWQRTDEWYNYRKNPRPGVHVVATVAERSYEGGTMGHDHPIAWAHANLGGRAFYTGLGHTEESYGEPYMRAHLLGAIEWAAGRRDADVMASRAAGFQEVVLTGALTDPMEIDIASDGRVFIVEWAGAIKIWEPETGKARVIGWLPVEKNIEDGLLGLALDPGFMDNGWVYIYYSPVTDGSKFNRLSRFDYDGRELVMESEISMLEIAVQRVQCCHSGGSIQFDKHGLLYLSTGDNSGGPRDHEDEAIRRMADHGRTSANTNDLRGKILRIRPEADGSYSIPEGNLFKADSLHRGEIFTMGHRNPFRISVDNATGWVYWGDVGPGNGNGVDEFNQARGPGFFGWPLFTGYNDPYNLYYVYGEEDMGPYLDTAAPVNASPYNTGARELPPAQPAWIPYFYGTSEEFPELGAGGLNPMAGPVFHYDASTAHENAFPPYYDDKVMIYEWMRNWVQVVTVNERGDIVKLDPFLPGLDYISPMDIEVGPRGRLYILEWGDEFWGSNPDAQLVRLDYYGSRPQPPPLARSESATGALRLDWPPDGGVFEFDAAIRYVVEVHDKARSDEVAVQTYTGFDTSPIALESFRGPDGEFAISRRFTHTPDVHYVDRFAEVEACLPDSGCDRVRLQPSLKEAEHVYASRNAARTTYSARPASEHWGGTALSAMQLEDSSRLAYKPVNLHGIDSITLRFRLHAPGAVRIGVEGGGELATLHLEAESGEPAVPRQAGYAAGVPEGASGMGLLKKDAYDNWREITVPVADPGKTFELVLDFASDHDKTFLELDWLRFNGQGIKNP